MSASRSPTGLRALWRPLTSKTGLASIILVVFGLSFLYAPWRATVHDHIDTAVSRPFLASHRGDTGVEKELVDGVLVYSRASSSDDLDLLWLGLSYDEGSWGSVEGSEHPRTFRDLQAIITAQQDPKRVSFGFLTSSLDEYTFYKQESVNLKYGKIQLIYHPGFGAGVDRDHRHDANVQTQRRAQLSQLRNYLMLRTLSNEPHILWVDADVYHLDDGIVDRMIRHAEEDKDYGILTARCSIGEQSNYDLNAWRGTRQGPRGWDLDKDEISAGELETQGQEWVEELIEGTNNDDLIPLDTVGATILFMRASLIWQGLNFPHQYVVGTRWRKSGWDGIESEGLCYRAIGLQGGKCGVLGGSWHVEHVNG